MTKVGSSVSAFKEGQRVTSLGWMGPEGNGSWQQYINVPAERVVALPDSISDEAGAQFYVSGRVAPSSVLGRLLVEVVCFLMLCQRCKHEC